MTAGKRQGVTRQQFLAFARPLSRYDGLGNGPQESAGRNHPRNDAAAVAIGSKSWPFDIRLRPWVFRPHIDLLTLRSLAGGDVRAVATNGLESGRFQGFLLVLTGNMSDQVITVRCGNFLVLGDKMARVQDLAASRSIVVTEQVVENAQASALLESSGLKPTLRRVTLSGIADEMSIYEIP